jgi:hypothetical protein
MTLENGHEVIPSARRLIMSLRGMGYDFAQAVADLVDNSIEAKASVVKVDIQFDGDKSWVRIADNGNGMTPDQLREAMRYRSERDYSNDDLGKFGLGLKTASMSQCQRLSVASRQNPDRANISAYAWDLAHIRRTNRWEILPIKDSELGSVICQSLKETTGTVILWQRLDHILGYKYPYGEYARKRLSQMCRDIEGHLAMVFCRFLSGKVKGKRLRIYLNNNEVKPWDAFCEAEKKTERLPHINIKVQHENVNGYVSFRPYILPRQSDFSSSEAFRQAGGPNNWNQQQGFYIFRSNRMIQSGGWCNFRTADEHTKLARIAVLFSPALDEAFKINVAKMRVQMPAQIRDEVRRETASIINQAKKTYNRKSTVPVSSVIQPSLLHVLQTTPQQSKKDYPIEPPVTHSELLTFKQWSERILAKVIAKERSTILEALKRLEPL